MMDIIGRPDFTGKTHSLRGVDGSVSHHIDPKITKNVQKVIHGPVSRTMYDSNITRISLASF